MGRTGLRSARAYGKRPQLRIYASSELHYCHEQAAELLGMGRQAVRNVPVDERYRMRLDSLSQMIAADRSRGDLPIAIVGTTGTVGTGAIDPIPDLLGVARHEDLWLHIDGAYGAFARRVEPVGIEGPDLEELQVAVIEEIEHRSIAVISNARLRDGRGALRGLHHELSHARTGYRGDCSGELGDRRRPGEDVATRLGGLIRRWFKQAPRPTLMSC